MLRLAVLLFLKMKCIYYISTWTKVTQVSDVAREPLVDCLFLFFVFVFYIITVKLVLNGHLREVLKVATYDRWPLNPVLRVNSKPNIWTSHKCYCISPGSHANLIIINAEHCNVHVGNHSHLQMYIMYMFYWLKMK